MTVAQENKILNDAEKILSLIKKRPCIIALDGRCAAGKSTLASVMKKEFGATVFHMDDFFSFAADENGRTLCFSGTKC